MLKELNKCEICPHNCKINRNTGNIGRCKATDKVKIALYSIHNYEEPCISGENGSGTVFFSNCNLNCIYCQNYEISQLGRGKEISIDELADIFLELQSENVENINLVTPTSYTIQIIEAIKIAKERGLKIPVVYNTNGYEKVETLKLLEGYVDIYLPDFKYADSETGIKYSKVKDYFNITRKAIGEMIRQTGKYQIDENGKLVKGVIIRHLVLPNNIENSKKVLKYVKENFGDKALISIMAQYFPTYLAKENSDINRKLNNEEWREIERYIDEIDIQEGFIQELGEHEEEYVPKWKY